MNRRLHSTRLTGATFKAVEDMVRWHGAVQAQDYGAARWAVGLRTAGTTGTDVDRAYDEGRILRTHVLRPTWHFVAPEDIRWMLQFTGPRVQAKMSSYYRKEGLTPRLLSRASGVIADALRGGARLTRAELAAVLLKAGINTDGMRATFLVGHAELEQIVCSGGRRGKQHTYALLDEVAPEGLRFDADAALAELTLRYLRSHGPARPQDLAWWAGLTVGQARTGLEMLGSDLATATVDGVQLWWVDGEDPPAHRTRLVRLLPTFDEYTVAYSDRRHHVDLGRVPAYPTAAALLSNVLTVDGLLFGLWRRKIAREGVLVELELMAGLPAGCEAALAAELDRYGRFLGVRARLA